ncbi:type IV pilin protein [Massilia sp. TS11]|uniref:type IV pilin protein n=1 Tax=Massilia sp. TS11 TaxID=2908003 RepID=UPI001EDBD483|nr:type IV pilin protein [Massilia sp. TS11]MCG2584057.1 type IV pilin protein [Massilia sp. TS11]
MRRSAGFTLVEILVTVAIVGILAAIAIPAYNQYLVKNNRRAAQAYLIDLAQAEQQYLMDARAYTSTLATLHVTAPPKLGENYTVSITTSDGPPPTFTITATPVSGSRQANDGALSIDQAGTKTPAANW